MKNLQKLGKALMQPVAVLPVAALLLGIGYWIDPTGWGANSKLAMLLIKSGGAILDNIPILFAAGVAYGLSKDKNGAAALSGLVSMLVLKTLLDPAVVSVLRGIEDIEKVANVMGFGKIYNALTGILCGILGAWSYNKFYDKKLPDALAFFSGRRMTPIIASILTIALSAVLLFIWPPVYGALVKFGNFMVERGALGAGLFGFFNRLLIPFGLHHALNSVFWFDVIGIGDLTNFLGGQSAIEAGKAVKGITGMYQAGFFPIMMFGLPAAALAMYHTAKPGKKKSAYGILFAGAVASILTGVTEPIEFAFMFLAPVLYVVHAVLTGLSLAIAALIHSTAGFGFSAGLIDFLLSLKNPVANKPLLLLVMGVGFAVIYYVLFRVLITKLNLKTPGREDDDAETMDMDSFTEIGGTKATSKSENKNSKEQYKKQAEIIMAGLGGKSNIKGLDYCITRIRAEVEDPSKVNEAQLKSAGVSGIMKPTKTNVQVIVGTQVQFVYDEMKKL